MAVDQLNLDNAHARIQAADSLDALESLRVALLGKQGVLTAELKRLGGLSPEQRKQQGEAINRLKGEVGHALAVRREVLEAEVLARRLATERVDVTLPGRAPDVGGLHLTTKTLREIRDIYAEMGFQEYRSRLVEMDDLNFGLLNMPKHHPARYRFG